MVYPARKSSQPRTGLVLNMLTLASLGLASTVAAEALPNLVFEPQPLTAAIQPSAALTPSIPHLPAFHQLRSSPAETIAAYTRSITTLQENNGPFDPELAEHYLALGRVY